MKCRSLKRLFEPYKDIIIFMITLLAANGLWKLTMDGDEYGKVVTWMGMDVTAPFAYMSYHVASVVYGLVGLFRDTVYLVNEQIIRFESGSGTTIVWGCTGLKQAFIWMCLILTVPPMKNRNLWLHKLWFIPMGWLVCYAFNILRVFLITLIIEHHQECFHLLHDYIFKYAFYAVLFGLWVLFVEKIKPTASSR